MSGTNQVTSRDPNLSPAKKQRRSPAKQRSPFADQSQATSRIRQDGRALQAEQASSSNPSQTQMPTTQMPPIPAVTGRLSHIQPMLPRILTSVRTPQTQPQLPELPTHPSEIPRIRSQAEISESLRARTQRQPALPNLPLFQPSLQNQTVPAAAAHSIGALPFRGPPASATVEASKGGEKSRIAEGALEMAKYFKKGAIVEMNRDNSLRSGLEGCRPSGLVPAIQIARPPTQGGQLMQQPHFASREAGLQAQSAQIASARDPILRQASHSSGIGAPPATFAHPGPTTYPRSEGPTLFVTDRQMSSNVNSFSSPRTGMPAISNTVIPLIGLTTLESEPCRAAASRLPEFQARLNAMARRVSQHNSVRGGDSRTAQASPYPVPVGRPNVGVEPEGPTSKSESAGPRSGAGLSSRSQSRPAPGLGATLASLGPQRKFPSSLEASPHSQCLPAQDIDHLRLTQALLEQSVRNLLPIMDVCEQEIVKAFFLGCQSRIKMVKSILLHDQIQAQLESNLQAKADCMAQWQTAVRRDPSFPTTPSGMELLASFERNSGNAIHLQRKQYELRHDDLRKAVAEHQRALTECDYSIRHERTFGSASAPNARLRELEAKSLSLQNELVFYCDSLNALERAGRQREQELTNFVRSTPPSGRRP